MIKKKNINVCVFCGSRQCNDPEYLKKSKKLGRYISDNNWNLVYGGGGEGLMGALASGIDTSKTKIISIIPENLNKTEILFKNFTKKILVKNLSDRKKEMINLSDIIIVLPGGFGTLDELSEILALNYLKETKKKIIILNINNYWEHLKILLSDMKKHKFVDDKFGAYLYFYNTIDKAIKFIKNNL